MSILSSTHTGMSNVPINKEELKIRGYNQVYSDGYEEIYAICSQDSFYSGPVKKWIGYRTQINLWLVTIDPHDYQEKAEKFDIIIQTIGDLMMLEKYWDTPEDNPKHKREILENFVNYVKEHYPC